MYYKLIDTDFKNPTDLVPVIAESLPIIEKTIEGKLNLTFTIRKEAKWENGQPITVKDVAFSIKTIKCPLVNNSHAKPLFSFINDFIFYPADDRKFTVVSSEVFFLSEASFTDIYILPAHVYDPKGLMKKITVKLISEKFDSLQSDPSIIEFANDFNSEKRMRDSKFMEGAGAYKLEKWITNERVIIAKKENWWGNSLNGINNYFETYPDKIIFQTIKDQTTALVSLKSGNIDAMRAIRAKDFADLPKSEKFVKNFNTYTPMEYSYVYIGINMKSLFLTDKKTRQALAHLVNIDELISVVKYGEAEKIIGPIHPSKSKAYNDNIKPYSYDPELSKKLLKEAGWENTNGDATLDKVFNGKRKEFIIDLIINSGNDERKSIALMFQEQAKKIGITVNVLSIDWAVFLGKCNKHEFDIVIGKWVTAASPDDLTQNYHSKSIVDGGSNYSNFSNAVLDSLIETTRREIDADKRNILYRKCQEILHEEVPMIFLYTPLEHIAISKKFENAYPSVARPGYWIPGFKLKK